MVKAYHQMSEWYWVLTEHLSSGTLLLRTAVITRALQLVGLGRVAAHLLWQSQVRPVKLDRYFDIVLFRVNEERIYGVSIVNIY